MPRDPERRSGRSDIELRRWRREIEHAWLARQPFVGSVLLINCIRDEQEMYAEHLRYSGIDPIVVCETPEAFQIAVSAQPVVIVTDLSIGNGVELIRQLREDARTRTSVIIVVSARVFPADRSAAEEAGCDVFLPKPCLPETLVTEIRRALPERRP